jgi:hypothetical protein
MQLEQPGQTQSIVTIPTTVKIKTPMMVRLKISGVLPKSPHLLQESSSDDDRATFVTFFFLGGVSDSSALSSVLAGCFGFFFGLIVFFFRPTPDGSRQVVYQAGKTIALCKFTELMQ